MKNLIFSVCLFLTSSAYAYAPVCPDVNSIHHAKLDAHLYQDGMYIAYGRSLQSLGTDNKWLVAIATRGYSTLSNARTALTKVNTMLDNYAMKDYDEEIGEIWMCAYYDDNTSSQALAVSKRCGDESCDFNFMAPNFSMSRFNKA